MKPNIKRLKELHSHMLNSRKFDKFDFSKYINYCGTAGCMLGDWAKANPRRWKFTDDGPILKKLECLISLVFPSYAIIKSIQSEFSISYELARHLFIPESQSTYLFGGRILTYGSRLPTVLKNLEIVIKKIEAGEIECNG